MGQFVGMKVLARAQRVLAWVFDLVIPARCVGCAALSRELCADCEHALLTRPKAPHGAVFVDTGAAARMVRVGKEGHTWGTGRVMARLTARRLQQRAVVLPRDIDVVTWVPHDPARGARRGTHQAELFARALARELQVPARPTMYRESGRRQRGAARGVRTHNVRSAFHLIHNVETGTRLAGRRVLLVDDVRTTGATLQAAAAVLHAAGPARVTPLAFTAVPLRAAF
jgi:predicted amidophosphoribosyltransferase